MLRIPRRRQNRKARGPWNTEIRGSVPFFRVFRVFRGLNLFLRRGLATKFAACVEEAIQCKVREVPADAGSKKRHPRSNGLLREASCGPHAASKSQIAAMKTDFNKLL